jgi:hypothetical protein
MEGALCGKSNPNFKNLAWHKYRYTFVPRKRSFSLIVLILFLLEYLYGLVEAAGLVIERDVANWIANQGGWVR